MIQIEPLPGPAPAAEAMAIAAAPRLAPPPAPVLRRPPGRTPLSRWLRSAPATPERKPA